MTDDSDRQRKPDIRAAVEDGKAVVTVLAMEAQSILGRRTAPSLGILALFAVVVGVLLATVSARLFGMAHTLTNLQKIFDIAQNAAAIAAIVVGGVWVYYQFVKGRTFTPRVEPKISVTATRRAYGIVYLVAEASLRNIGRGTFQVNSEPTSLRILARGTESEDWVRLRTSGIFGDQRGLEPGEIADLTMWIDVPETMPDNSGDIIAVDLRLYVFNIEGDVWRANDIVNIPAREHNEGDEK